MKALDTNIPSSSRRGPVRMDTQDGPWSVSVAENPYDSLSYSLYIKTPTHNLTLTRTAMELVELDLKLRQSHPNLKIPALPIHPDSLPAPPPKRKSTFLNTLSRLTSPASAKDKKNASKDGRRNQNASLATSLASPVVTPAKEANDPFGSFTSINVDANPAMNGNPPAPSTASSTAIAAYLTTVSNTPALRMDRLWKRFVRVRTDDLESVRVERAIKRVRSDLAAHIGISSKDNKENAKASLAGSAASSILEKERDNTTDMLESHVETHGEEEAEDDARKRDEEMTVDDEQAGIEDGSEQHEQTEIGHHPSKANNATDSTATQVETDANRTGVDIAHTINLSDDVEKLTGDAAEDVDMDAQQPQAQVAEEEAEGETIPPTPIATEPQSASNNRPQMHRSQSADPDKSHRLSRAYTSSVSQSGAESQTGDESSSSRSSSRLGSSTSTTSGTPKEKEPRKSQRKVVIDDFEMMRVLGKGCAGKVLLVRHKSTQDLFALKAITKRHVLAHQELQHTLTEQAVLKRMAAENRDPFVVKLWWSFHDKDNLFLVMDFHPGGDLATQLARWGRLGRDRARFYAAEIVEGVEGLHAAGVIYRDLKPENILIGADGHIVLTDFGLSKEFPRRHTTSSAPLTPSGSHGSGSEFYSSVPGSPQPATPPWMKPDRTGELALGWPGQPIGHTDVTSTFCGTAEYLAPEVIQGLPYSYEVDWWSFGTMLYEMLTGITPFWANNHSDMYVRVLQDELQFPDDRAIDHDTKSLIRGLLQRVPSLRICEPRIKKHPYFSMIDWSHVYYKRYIPPYIPPIDPSNASDTQNFDETFLDMEPVLDDFDENEEATDTDQEPQTDADRTDGEETNTTPSQSRSSSIRPPPPLAQPPAEYDVDVFDGYSFKGRHSVLIDDEDEEEAEHGSSEGSEEESMEDEADELSVLKEQPAEIDRTSLLTEEDGLLEEGLEPKTPEARPAGLPPVVESEIDSAASTEAVEGEEPAEAASTEIEEVPIMEQPEVKEVPAPAKRISKDVSTYKPVEAVPPVKETNGRTTTPPPKAIPPRPAANVRSARPRREKSGVPALDRYLTDGVDEDTEATEAERDEDDDWDFIEAADGEDRNGAKGTSLFARGVVDRYRLAVFRKASTPSRNGQRSVSGMSNVSDATASETGSPSPTQRRGRTGLKFRKHPRQFLRPRSPPPSAYPSSAWSISQSATNSNSNTISAASTTSGGGMLSSSLSVGSTFNSPHSLKSKESAMSVGAQSQSSDQSNGMSAVLVDAADAIRSSPQSNGPAPRSKGKKLKKYKNNAEKVFSLFSSPRQTQTPS
ncbi:hypothetical protein CPB84DRAFT_1673057 [Gymnopilus junonius]|uniref:non-specific serine/threonine protein kinase n=1 Tax=Gymnopilus junonius TaxID=109634 RepID=A0A9P5NZN0_GYMJU|nr:hypothetical protein CPB84DRAFT_1673057 [Gymnopilus junonius]